MRRLYRTMPIVLAILILGCSDPDARLLELSRESLDRQAEQNEHITQQSQEVAEASRELVEADAQARREMIEVHKELQSERSSLDRQHEVLEDERRQIARTRHRDPIIAGALQTAGLLIAAVLPLLVCVYLLRGLWGSSDAEAVGELLIDELTRETSALLPPPETGSSSFAASPAAAPRLASTRDTTEGSPSVE